MDNSLSASGADGLHRYLDRAEVLQAVVDQLRKDLSVSEEELPLPKLSERTFDLLSATVLPVLQDLQVADGHALQVAMYRVDIPEAHLRRTMGHGGLSGLADEVVLRALQKVLTRLRYAGRF